MFDGKVVLITGASSGIGAATAVKLAKVGASLSLTGRNRDNLEKVAAECTKESGIWPYTVIGDLDKEDDITNIFASTIGFYGKLDVLINNAGTGGYGSIENTSLEQLDQIFNTNVKSVYYLTMLAVPDLIESKGTIVNVSSLFGIRSVPNALAYSMSKAALDQFTKCVALELASKQVRVNSVNPGTIVTGIHQRAGMDDEAYKNVLEGSKETHALGRPGNSEEVADAIIFLAGDQSSFITGVNLPVDGGRQIMCPTVSFS